MTIELLTKKEEIRTIFCSNFRIEERSDSPMKHKIMHIFDYENKMTGLINLKNIVYFVVKG